jgi:basic membrane protein A and related proteins
VKLRSWRLFAALLVMMALVAAACGDDDDDDDDAATDTGATTETSAGSTDTSTADTTGETTGDTTADTGGTGTPAENLNVGLVFDVGGRGDQSFNDSAVAGFDEATAEFGFTTQELEPDQGGENREELLRLLGDEGYGLVFAVGFAFAESVGAVSADYPDTTFAIIDDASIEAPNVASLVFAEEQGSFLVGAAAALTSTTGHVGFIGGVDIDLIHKFEAGFTAGAQAVNPDVVVDVDYISPAGDFTGFNDPARAQEIATAQYESGADVIFHAAGGSGGGLFSAAAEYSDSSGSQVWAIGVDSDQYLTADPSVQPYILTSMLKQVGQAVYLTSEAYANGTLEAGTTVFDLSVDGVGYSTSGDFLSEDVIAQLEDLKAQIIAGDIEVPTTP